MEKDAIQNKYQKLAAEFSKVRSQAAVLKKGVIDEQNKNTDLNEQVKNLEQTLRIRDQEMESLLFRNEQLTKRISVLQQELQMNNTVKKGKHKPNEVVSNNDSLFNEELQKKILENAQLLNLLTEKDSEIFEYKEKLKNIEDVLNSLKNDLEYKSKLHSEEVEHYKNEKDRLERKIADSHFSNKQTSHISDEDVTLWKGEIERWKTECEILKSRPKTDDEVTTYYETQLSQLFQKNVLLESETKTGWAENMALKARLENITIEFSNLKANLESSYDDLKITNNNYKTQLDAMTEHLASQNEKITRQCDEIQFLKHKLSGKNKG